MAEQSPSSHFEDVPLEEARRMGSPQNWPGAGQDASVKLAVQGSASSAGGAQASLSPHAVPRRWAWLFEVAVP
jgi:hypothetical protein